jgi:hypothetical protein
MTCPSLELARSSLDLLLKLGLIKPGEHQSALDPALWEDAPALRTPGEVLGWIMTRVSPDEAANLSGRMAEKDSRSAAEQEQAAAIAAEARELLSPGG